MPLIRPRSEWGSTYDYAKRAADKPAPRAKDGAYLHHSVTLAPDLLATTLQEREDEHRAMRLLESIGRQRFRSGVSYNVGVMPSGEAYEGNPLNAKGTHSGEADHNYRYASIVLVGNYQSGKPTLKARLKVVRILVHWRKAKVLATLSGCLVPHSRFKATSCPGENARVLIPGIIAQAKVLFAVVPLPAPKPPAPTHPAFKQGRKVYRSKMRPGQQNSASVWNVRAALIRKGYKSVSPGDDYTAAVRDAVAHFQRRQGWTGGDANGIVGPVTCKRLGLVWVQD